MSVYLPACSGICLSTDFDTLIAMPPQRNGGATVFIGNINYDATEDQLKDIFSQVGTVVNIRVVYDNDTGRPKGYGFCEYEDAETAMSARRNLNGFELNGRQLRVDFTESDKTAQAGSSTGRAANINGSGGTVAGGVVLPDSLSGPSPSLAMLSLPQLHEVMLQLKRAVADHPKETRDLFMKNPQLAHAVLQGQILLGMVPLPPPPPQMQGGAPGQIGHAAPLPPPPGIQPGAILPPGAGGPIGASAAAPSAMGAIPPGVSPAITGGLPGIPPALHGPPQSQPLMDQAALLKQVCEMTPQAIEKLPIETREQVLQLQQLARQQSGMGKPASLGPISGPPQPGPRGPFM